MSCIYLNLLRTMSLPSRNQSLTTILFLPILSFNLENYKISLNKDLKNMGEIWGIWQVCCQEILVFGRKVWYWERNRLFSSMKFHIKKQTYFPALDMKFSFLLLKPSREQAASIFCKLLIMVNHPMTKDITPQIYYLLKNTYFPKIHDFKHMLIT